MKRKMVRESVAVRWYHSTGMRDARRTPRSEERGIVRATVPSSSLSVLATSSVASSCDRFDCSDLAGRESRRSPLLPRRGPPPSRERDGLPPLAVTRRRRLATGGRFPFEDRPTGSRAIKEISMAAKKKGGRKKAAKKAKKKK
jgi:hypothetical protein